ncbi:predicted protein [Botrytis cinerea T4]|uniref:Uncharacterized protein n=1 Tax=Botryotinia fuckeliana (strain T4) TaxID=999810 RepID=G2YUC8_BOTF4|nr:predicted protein [Botrytis cinerea T4]
MPMFHHNTVNTSIGYCPQIIQCTRTRDLAIVSPSTNLGCASRKEGSEDMW